MQDEDSGEGAEEELEAAGLQETPQPPQTTEQDENWADFLDVLQQQSPIAFFDEDTTNIDSLDYRQLLDFSHMSTPSTTQFRQLDSSDDTLPYNNPDTVPTPTQHFTRRVTESGLSDVILMNPFRIHTRTHRHIPVWVIESDDEDSTSDAGPSTQPDNDVASPALPFGDGAPTEAAPDQPPVLYAPSGAEIRARYTANHGGMKCLPKNFQKLLADTEPIQVLYDSHQVLPPRFAYLAKGINLVFLEQPPPIKRVTPNTRLSAFLISYLLKQKVISPVPSDPLVPTFRLFAVPKPNDKFRPIVDFSPLTTFLKTPKF